MRDDKRIISYTDSLNKLLLVINDLGEDENNSSIILDELQTIALTLATNIFDKMVRENDGEFPIIDGLNKDIISMNSYKALIKIQQSNSNYDSFLKKMDNIVIDYANNLLMMANHKPLTDDMHKQFLSMYYNIGFMSIDIDHDVKYPKPKLWKSYGFFIEVIAKFINDDMHTPTRILNQLDKFYTLFIRDIYIFDKEERNYLLNMMYNITSRLTGSGKLFAENFTAVEIMKHHLKTFYDRMSDKTDDYENISMEFDYIYTNDFRNTKKSIEDFLLLYNVAKNNNLIGVMK